MKNVACQQCGFEQNENFKFCVDCGAKLKCNQCGNPLSKNAKFCSECGNSLMLEKAIQSQNTVKLRETLSENERGRTVERSLEAAFSDTVGKDIAEIIYSPQVKGIPINFDNAINNLKSNSDFKDNENKENEDVTIDEELKVSKIDLDITSSTINTSNSIQDEYPTLKAIAMKNLPSTELEWFLLCSFYASNFGKEIFTRDDIVNRYIEANKYEKSKTRSNLFKQIQRATAKSYVNPLQNDSYSILDAGFDKVEEILSRTASSNPKVKRKNSNQVTTNEAETVESKSKKNTSRRTHNIKRLTGIDFYPKNQESLEDYVNKFTFKNDNERNLIFVAYLQEVLMISDITFDHIYTCYDELKFKIPENISSNISNTKTRTGWIESNNSYLRLTIKGRNKLTHWEK